MDSAVFFKYDRKKIQFELEQEEWKKVKKLKRIVSCMKEIKMNLKRV